MFAKLKNGLRTCARVAKRTFGIKTEYKYKNFSIFLPADHMLPTNQRHHLKYDRFLPHLGKYIDHDGTVIDIGANCGDTLAAMIETNPHATYICIEPDDRFFAYLEANITRIKSYAGDIRVRTVKSLVGKNISSASLEGGRGTKHAVIGNEKSSHSSRSLDSILADLTCPRIRLLKTDVDGFDYDVLDSAETLLSTHHPIVFFECYFDFEYQKLGYEKTIRWLESLGYLDWTVFDNFGEIILRTKDIGQVVQLMNYVWKQNMKSATRTIHYYDVLATTHQDVALIDRALKDY